MVEYWSLLNIVLLVSDARRIYRRPDSIFNFLVFCYSLIIGAGIVFVQLMDIVVGYKFQLRDLDVLQKYFIIGYLSIFAGAYFTRGVMSLVAKRRGVEVPISYGNPASVSRQSRMGLYGLGLVSVAAVLIYVAVNGLSFGSGSYEGRYEDAQGMGIILRLFPAFLPFAAYKLAMSTNRSGYIKVALALIAFTGFMYVALDGYRQLLIAALLLVVIVAMKRRFIPAAWLLATATAAVPAFVALSFLRYSGDSGGFTFTDVLSQALYYVQGDIFPVDAPLRTYWWCNTRQCPGFDVFFNHLSLLVPRFLWPDKPDILLDAAGYYTQIIVNYPRALTLSSTILGESIMIGGPVAVLLICFFSGSLAYLLSAIMDRARGILKYILLANVSMGFFWVREGLENGILRTLFIFFFAAMGVALAPLVAVLFDNFRRQPSGALDR